MFPPFGIVMNRNSELRQLNAQLKQCQLAMERVARELLSCAPPFLTYLSHTFFLFL